jgi:hypothetical protein
MISRNELFAPKAPLLVSQKLMGTPTKALPKILRRKHFR